MKIFIAGPRAIRKLNSEVTGQLDSIISKEYTILLGDANGVDKAVQHFCNEQNYDNVKVYATKGKARNNIRNWPIHSVEVSSKLKGFEFYAAKDFAMAKDADYGLMIWNGQSKGTLNNIINLLKMDKKTLLYYTPEKKLYILKTLNGLKLFINRCNNETQDLFNELSSKNMQIEMDL